MAIPTTGTITASAGTNLNTSLLALEAGGNLGALASTKAEAGIVSGPTELTAPPSAVLVGGREDSGDFHAINVDGSGTIGVNVLSMPGNANVALETGGNAAATLAAITSGIQVTQVSALPLPPGAALELGNNALQTQILAQLLAEAQRQTALLKKVLAATGNEPPDNDSLDSEIQGAAQWQLQ